MGRMLRLACLVFAVAGWFAISATPVFAVADVNVQVGGRLPPQIGGGTLVISRPDGTATRRIAVPNPPPVSTIPATPTQPATPVVPTTQTATNVQLESGTYVVTLVGTDGATQATTMVTTDGTGTVNIGINDGRLTATATPGVARRPSRPSDPILTFTGSGGRTSYGGGPGTMTSFDRFLGFLLTDFQSFEYDDDSSGTFGASLTFNPLPLLNIDVPFRPYLSLGYNSGGGTRQGTFAGINPVLRGFGVAETEQNRSISLLFGAGVSANTLYGLVDTPPGNLSPFLQNFYLDVYGGMYFSRQTNRFTVTDAGVPPFASRPTVFEEEHSSTDPAIGFGFSYEVARLHNQFPITLGTSFTWIFRDGRAISAADPNLPATQRWEFANGRDGTDFQWNIFNVSIGWAPPRR